MRFIRQQKACKNKKPKLGCENPVLKCGAVEINQSVNAVKNHYSVYRDYIFLKYKF